MRKTTVSMSLLSADNLTYDITEDAIEQKAVPVVIKDEELSKDTKVTRVASDSDANVQAASGSEIQNVSDQEEEEVGGLFFWRKCQTSSREKK